MLLSVIIPIYNAGRVLRRTIDSVLNQGLKDAEWELILVDDGSTDESLLICQEYCHRFPNLVKVITQKNSGVSAARNSGMSIARGQYLYFMDADDYLMPGGFRYLIDIFLQEDYDILAFYTETIPDFDENHLPQGNIKGNVVYEGYGIDYLRINWQTFAVNQLFKRDFIQKNNITFEKMNYSEDLYFNLQVWTKNPKVKVVSSKIYRYIIYSGDHQATKNRDNEHLRRCINSHMKLFSYISELNTCFKEEHNSINMERLFQSVMRSFMSRVLSSNLSTSEFKRIISKLSELGLIPMKNIKSKSTRIISLMIKNYYLFPLYKVLYQRLFIPIILPKLSRQ